MVSKQVEQLNESSTLLALQKAMRLKTEGKRIINLTAGQLPFKPMPALTQLVAKKSEELASYQYTPTAGLPPLRKKLLETFQKSRGVYLNNFDVLIANGAKQAIYEAVLSIINPGDEVILLAPYWVSYCEIIKMAGGIVKVIDARPEENYIPSLMDIQQAITPRTKLFILNSPNNPSGVIYPLAWIRCLGDILTVQSHVTLLSDEIYFELSYIGSKPIYPYVFKPELLERTIIIDGISKSLACTGLRIGYAYGPKHLIEPMVKLQGHLTSGANALTQEVLLDLDFSLITPFMLPINEHLLYNHCLIKQIFNEKKLAHILYNPTGAFYYLLDLSKSAKFKKQQASEEGADLSNLMADQILDQLGIATVSGADFGLKNSLRISLVLDHKEFEEAITLLADYLNS